ncbi:MAG: peptide chain release factor aRF-1 [Candidatus Aenigmatarchaeota archaeon]
MEEEKMLRLKKIVKELEKIKGRHTELVSVYIPSGSNLQEVINMLREEYSLAQNVKDKTVRKNVMSALEKIIQHLRIFRTTPENGLVVFCGNVSPDPGTSNIRIWSLEPPEKVSVKIYRCDQVFVLEPLKEMLREKEVYGLIVLDASEANIGLLKRKAVEEVKRLESTVPSKSVKGGMSQRRYDRLREDALNEFFTTIGEIASNLFLQEPELKGVLVGGPGPTKETFVQGNYLHHKIQKKVLGTKDTSYTGEYGLRELVNRSEDLLEKASIMKEKEIMEKFFSQLQKGGNVTYGFNETLKALEVGAVETLLISEGFDWVFAKLKCNKCNVVEEKYLPKNKVENQFCERCNQIMNVESTEEVMEKLTENAKNLGTKVEFISTESSEGAQFKELGGIGAFLRYKIN